MSTHEHEDIAKLAYRFWEERGRPPGSPEVDWYQAERELEAGIHQGRSPLRPPGHLGQVPLEFGDLRRQQFNWPRTSSSLASTGSPRSDGDDGRRGGPRPD